MFGLFKRKERREEQKRHERPADPPQLYSFHVSYYDRLDIRDPNDGPPEVHLMNGREFAMKTWPEVRKIIFTDEPVKLDRMHFDASMEQDGSVTAWYEKETMYVTSGRKGVPIKAPRDSRCMFLARPNLETVDFRNLDFSTAEEMSTMFGCCPKLRYLDLSGMDVSNVTCFNEMFGECPKLRYLNLSGWDTRKCRNYDKMFLNCECLRVVDLSHFDTTSAPALSATHMFSGCKRLEAVILGNFHVKVPDEDQRARFWAVMALDCSDMFQYTENLSTLVATDPRIIAEFKKDDIAISPVRNVIKPSEWSPKVAEEKDIKVELDVYDWDNVYDPSQAK